MQKEDKELSELFEEAIKIAKEEYDKKYKKEKNTNISQKERLINAYAAFSEFTINEVSIDDLVI